MEEGFIVTGSHAEEKRLLAWQMRREMTPGERMLWQRLRASRLDGLHFRRQQVIDGFIADFFCHAAWLVVEVDGDVHNDRQDYDAERDRLLAARGVRILRFTNAAVMTGLPRVLNRILAAAREQCGTPEPPPNPFPPREGWRASSETG